MADRIVKPVFNPVLQFNTPSSLQQDLQPMPTVPQPLHPTFQQQHIIQPTVHHQQPIQSTFRQQPQAVHNQQTDIMPNQTTEIQSNLSEASNCNLFPESQNLLNCLRMANSALNEFEDSPTFGNGTINNINDAYIDHSHDECNARISQLEERVKFLESNLLKDFLGKLSSKGKSPFFGLI